MALRIKATSKRSFCKQTKISKNLTLIVSSTQERAIRTAVVGLGHLIDSGQAVGFALDTAREFVTAERGERRTKSPID